MDIGTIIAGLQAIASIAESMNKAPQLTPAQAEGEKPKKQGAQQPSMVVVLPNQTPPMGVGVPPPPPPLPPSDDWSYWNQPPPANMLQNPMWRMIQPPNDVAPVFRGFPPSTEAPIYLVSFDPLLAELYNLYFGSRR